MLALIAGTGDLPPALVARLPERPLVCALAGFAPSLDVDMTFRLERFGSFLARLQALGVTEVCMAGSVRRPMIDPAEIDAETQPLVPRMVAAMAGGDDGALRAFIALFEEAGFAVRAAHEIAPDLLPRSGVPTRSLPDAAAEVDARRGAEVVAEMGRADLGQACVIRGGAVLAREGDAGTDAMLATLSAPMPERGGNAFDPFEAVFDLAGDVIGGVADWLSNAPDVPDDAPGAGAILFKAPKPDQDRRADLPTIGPATAMRAAEAGLAGIVIEAGGVIVLDLPQVIAVLDAQGMFLWVRAPK